MKPFSQPSTEPIKYLLFTALVMLVLVIVSGSAFNGAASPPKEAAPPPEINATQNAGTEVTEGAATRNLSLQPEALKFGMRIGRRFRATDGTISVLNGTLTVGTDNQTVQLSRQQTRRGERIQFVMSGSPSSLTWDEAEGPKADGASTNETQRAMIEQLTFDSPDQFVLAQLRGASYYTVARNVRPAASEDADNNAVWDIVRIDDPDQDVDRRPRSSWRLYFINTKTGLIDKIVSEVGGEKITASLSNWQIQAGERLPARIVWTRHGNPIMEFSLLSFSLTSAQ